MEKILDALEQTPVIAAIKDDAGLENCLTCNAQVVFILYGSILGIRPVVERIRGADKAAFVHIDLIDGLSAKDVAVDYIRQNTEAQGIISTKPTLIRRAKELGLLAVRRYFLLDSMAMANIQKQLPAESADLVEVLPGVMPKQMRIIAEKAHMPLIAGGLIDSKDDVLAALSAGAIAVSTSNPTVWNL